VKKKEIRERERGKGSKGRIRRRKVEKRKEKDDLRRCAKIKIKIHRAKFCTTSPKVIIHPYQKKNVIYNTVYSFSYCNLIMRMLYILHLSTFY
jgi:hypothetical protein